eukprot:5821748-Karenia_brevis.AAC.1
MEFEADLAGAALQEDGMKGPQVSQEPFSFEAGQVDTRGQLNPGATEHFGIGTLVEIEGLATRSDLCGQFGKVTAAVTANGRYAIQ